VVPQEGHLPWIALRPFLKVTVLVEVISLFFLSFTQKARVMIRDAVSLDIRWAVQLCILSYEEMLTYEDPEHHRKFQTATVAADPPQVINKVRAPRGR
jgi:hypothetical protein